MAANFGKFFGRKKNKAQVSKLKAQGSSQADDSDEDEGYQDPTENCPTEPPGVARTFMPTYPPPRPNSPKLGSKLQQSQQQPKRDDYQDPWDSKRSHDRNVEQKLQTDYEDPFDSKFVNEKQNSINQDSEDYSEPYEPADSNFKPPTDTYEDPWDTRKNIDTSGGQSIRTMSSSNSNTASINNKPADSKKDDYSDPWDSKESSSFKSTDEFDDTYSDPYDTDKPTILDGNRKSTVAAEEDDEDLYDMPEDEKNIVLGLSGNSSNLRSAFQKSNSFSASVNNQSISRPPIATRPLPSQQAPTPAPQAPTPSPQPTKSDTIQSQGDYDAPWEWQAKNVEAEFAKRFSVGEATKHQVLPQQPAVPPRNKSTPNVLIKDLNINPVPKPNRNNFTSLVADGPKEHEVDPSVPLENQRWFHGLIRRGEAEEQLRALPDCSYLIRNSESNRKDYSLSLRNNGATMHLKISCRDGKYILGQNSRPYDTIPDMIHHYSQNKLNIRGAEHVKLQYPVLQEAMYFTLEPET